MSFKSKYTISQFSTMLTNMNDDLRTPEQHQLLCNVILDTTGTAKKRTGFKNALSQELQEFITGNKNGIFYFKGKIGECEVPDTNEEDVINKHQEDYIQGGTEGNSNITASNNVIDYNADDIFDKAKSIKTEHLLGVQEVFFTRPVDFKETYVGEIGDVVEVDVSGNSAEYVGTVTYTLTKSNVINDSLVGTVQGFARGSKEFRNPSKGIVENHPSDWYRVRAREEVLPPLSDLFSFDHHIVRNTEDPEENPYFQAFINIESGIRIWEYSLQAGTSPSIMISEWELQASLDGNVFETLDSQSGVTWTSNETKSFVIGQEGEEYTKPYRFFRIAFKPDQENQIRYFGFKRATVIPGLGKYITSADIDNYNTPNFNSPIHSFYLLAHNEIISVVYSDQDRGETVIGVTPGQLVYDNISNHQIINGVQFENDLYIATGKKFIRVRFAVDTVSKSVIVITDEMETIAHNPTINQDIVLGGNAFHPSYPFDVVNNLAAPAFKISNVRSIPFFGIESIPTVFRVFYNAKSLSDIDFQWYIKKSTDDDFPDDWEYRSTIPTFNKEWEGEGTYNIKVVMYDGLDIVDTLVFSYVVDNNQTLEKQGFIPCDITDVDEQGNHKCDFEGFNAPKITDEINTCTNIMVYYGKLVLWGNGSENMYTSIPKFPTYFSARNVLTVDSETSEEILSIVPFKDMLLVGTKNRLWGIIGKGDLIATDDFDPYFVIGLESVTGIVGSNAMVQFENTVAITTSRGIYVVNQVEIASKRIELIEIDKAIKNKVFQDIDDSELSKIAMGYYDRKLYISMPTEDVSKNKIWVYDLETESGWTIFKSLETDIVFFKVINNQMFCINQNSQAVMIKQPEILEIDYSQTEYEPDLFLDNLKRYNAEIETSYMALGYVDYIKVLQNIMIEYSNVLNQEAQINAQVIVDGVELISQDKTEIANNKNYEAFEFGVSLLGEAQLGYKPKNIYIRDARNFENITSFTRIKIILSNDQPIPWFISRIVFEFLVGDKKGDNLLY